MVLIFYHYWYHCHIIIINTNNPLPGDDDLKLLLIIIVIIIIIININYPPPGGAYLRLAHAVRLHPHAHIEQPDHHGPQQVSSKEYKNEQLLMQIMVISQKYKKTNNY